MLVARIFISAFNEAKRDRLENLSMNETLRRMLKGHELTADIATMAGVYDGKAEPSFMVVLPTAMELSQLRPWLLQTMAFFDQQCVLLEAPTSRCALLHCDDTVQGIGYMKKVATKPEGDHSMVVIPPPSRPELKGVYYVA